MSVLRTRVPLLNREADPLWDALTEGFGEVRTAQERARRNKAVKELRAADATSEEIAIAIEFCRRNFTHFTEMAVCSWFSQALREQKERGQSRETLLRLVQRASKPERKAQ